MITSYALRGDFIESCDCFDLCPCWVDDDPDEDHRTGLVVWKLGEGSTIGTKSGGLDVSGCRRRCRWCARSRRSTAAGRGSHCSASVQ
jgi:hypothetical protein